MYTIAVTGVGGGVGQSILKSLDRTDYDLVALDADVLAAGMYAVPRACLIPYARNPEYIPALLDICEKESVSLLFPGLDAELMPLSLNSEKFKAIGTTVVVSRPEVIAISDDKQETFNRLSNFGIHVPFTVGLLDYVPDDARLPVIIKQKVGGARSKNVFVIRDETEWNITLEKIGNTQSDYIVQEYIEGEEYTCGSVNLDGECKGVIVMRRILRDGDTYKCFSENNTVIEAAVEKIAAAIKPFGACNIQLKMKNGIPYVFEINARCSGTTASRTLCGFNEPKMIADYLLKGVEPSYRIQQKTVLRYWNELVVENDAVKQMNTTQELKRSSYSSL